MALLTLNVYAGYEKQIVIPSSAMQDSWDSFPGYLEHKLNVKSSIHKKVSSLKLNTLYRITYEVYDYINCTVQLKVGSQEGAVRSGPGIYTESFMINSEADKTLSFVSDGLLKIRGLAFEEKVFITESIPFTDKTMFQNKSWTLSYSFYSNSWISWHSYMPLYYIHNQSNLYSFVGIEDTHVWKHNAEGIYQTYYGQRYPFIVEFVACSNPLQTQLWDDLTILTKARTYDPTTKQFIDDRFITFNKMIAYNDRQSTGEVLVVVKDTQPNPENWYSQQVVNTPGTILITRKEKDWNLNELRDNVADPTKALFSSAWVDIGNGYYMDKVPNPANIDFEKDWNDMESLRDKYLAVRLKFDNFDNVNLIFNFSLESEQISSR